MSQWEIRGIELEIDMDDYDFQVKYENAFEKMAVVEKELQKVGKASEVTKGYCQMFRDLFDDIFGDGTAEKLFSEKYSMSDVDAVYEEFIGVCGEQAKKAADRLGKLASKYKPNRAQRRSK